MNNEPVAWIVSHNSYTIKEAAEAMSKLLDEPMIPLYTHPVKEQDESFDRTASHMVGEYVSYKAELTDEEIYKIASQIEAIQPQHGLRLSNDLNVMDFARAILLKAQE